MASLLLSALLLATSLFPATGKTGWMQPEAFRLTIGMERRTAVAQLKKLGLKETKSKEKESVAFAYDDQRTLTLAFAKSRLHSIRFEYVDFIPGVKSAFEEQESALAAKLGQARQKVPGTLLVYDEKTPNVFVVTSIDTASEAGKQGIGTLVVRYFDPAVR